MQPGPDHVRPERSEGPGGKFPTCHLPHAVTRSNAAEGDRMNPPRHHMRTRPRTHVEVFAPDTDASLGGGPQSLIAGGQRDRPPPSRGLRQSTKSAIQISRTVRSQEVFRAPSRGRYRGKCRDSVTRIASSQSRRNSGAPSKRRPSTADSPSPEVQAHPVMLRNADRPTQMPHSPSTTATTIVAAQRLPAIQHTTDDTYPLKRFRGNED